MSFGKRAILAHLADEPQHAFVVDEEAPHAQIVAALDIFNAAQYLLHAAQAVADAHALWRQHRGAGVIGGARAG